MSNSITGKVIAISQIEEVASSQPGKEPFKKRSIFLDCTRFDPYTGERGRENTPLLEFGGKALDKLNELVDKGLKKDDIVTISFDIQGTKYTKDNKTQVFTRVRPFDIELYKPKDSQQQPASAPAATAAPVTSQDGNDDLPFN